MASKWLPSKSFKLGLPRRWQKTDAPSTLVSSPTMPNRGRNNKLQEAFQYLDRNGDGKVSSEELRAFFASMGENMAQDEAEAAIMGLDSDGDQLLDFGGFLALMECDHGKDDDDNDLRRAFEMFEINKGSGCITPTGLQRMLNRLGDPKSHDECAAMIRVFDLDGNGVVDFHEFRLMMT